MAAGLWLAFEKQTHATPESSTAQFLHALDSRDLGVVRSQLVPAVYDEFVQTFGNQRFERVEHAYDQAYRLGDARWVEIRERARDLASQDYDQIRLRVTNLGKEAFAALPVDERMKLMDDQALYGEFVFAHGVSALSPTDRARIGSAAEFKLSEDRDAFLDREGFSALGSEDKALAGSAAALANGQTAAKTLLHDRFGIPLLPRPLRDEIGSITRADLQDVAAFKLKFGEPVAKKFMQDHVTASAPALQPCTYTWVSEQGSLLKGNEAICNLHYTTRRGTQVASVHFTKEGFEWRVSRVGPTIADLPWTERAP